MIPLTPLCQTILNQYQVRKSAKQKQAFINLLRSHFPELTLQEGGFPRCRNIIIGNIEKAEVILSAHYDTCAQLPFPNFIMPKNPVLSILYSVILIVPVVIAVSLLKLVLNMMGSDFWIQYWLSLAVCISFMLLLIAGPANKHTANDNTSGVIALCELLNVLTAPERSKAAFVFFDHEETGLVGSSLFRSKYKKLMKDKLLINFDCVSDGDHILVSASKKARAEFADLIKDSFEPIGSKMILFEKAEKIYFPSDQLVFPIAVAVAALKRKRFLGYYMDRIHTSRDTVFDKENIKLLCDSIHRLLKQI